MDTDSAVADSDTSSCWTVPAWWRLKDIDSLTRADIVGRRCRIETAAIDERGVLREIQQPETPDGDLTFVFENGMKLLYARGSLKWCFGPKGHIIVVGDDGSMITLYPNPHP